MEAFRSPVARLAATITLAVFAASPQAAPEHARKDPANPAAEVPALTYRSSLNDRRRIGDEPLGNWRASNDKVRAVGGWRAYAREAAAPEASDKATPASPANHGAHSGMPKER